METLPYSLHISQLTRPFSWVHTDKIILQFIVLRLKFRRFRRCYQILCGSFRRLDHVARARRADKSQDHSRALQACISPAPRNWRRRPGRPRHTWLRTVEGDLRQFNLGLASGLRRAQNRTAWRTLTGTATSPTSSDWWRCRRGRTRSH